MTEEERIELSRQHAEHLRDLENQFKSNTITNETRKRGQFLIEHGYGCVTCQADTLIWNNMHPMYKASGI